MPDSVPHPLPSRSPGNRVLLGRFDDFDRVREAIGGWELDWLQLDSGTLSAEILQIETGAALLAHVGFSRRFQQLGGAPPGLRTFGVLDEGIAGVRWCAKQVTDGNILCFPESGQYESISEPGFAANTLSFPEAHLAAVAEAIGTPESGDLMYRGRGAPRADPIAVGALRYRLRQVYSEIARRPSALDSAGFREQLELDIPALLLQALGTVREESSGKPSARSRSLGFTRAVEFMRGHAEEAVTVREVCRAAGVSWRTLNYAFRERLGVTPKQYLTALRLGAVRRELASAGSKVTIADVANRWGFWHMGQFAADFRKHFGELPSQFVGRMVESQTSPVP